jgi:DNA-binding transcriptional regulator YbjK
MQAQAKQQVSQLQQWWSGVSSQKQQTQPEIVTKINKMSFTNLVQSGIITFTIMDASRFPEFA